MNGKFNVDRNKFENTFYRQTFETSRFIAIIKHMEYDVYYENGKEVYGIKVKNSNIFITKFIKEFINNKEIYNIINNNTELEKLSYSQYNDMFKITYIILKELEMEKNTVISDNMKYKFCNIKRNMSKTKLVFERENFDENNDIIYIKKDGRNIWGILNCIDFEENFECDYNIDIWRKRDDVGYIIKKEIETDKLIALIETEIKLLVDLKEFDVFREICI